MNHEKLIICVRKEASNSLLHHLIRDFIKASVMENGTNIRLVKESHRSPIFATQVKNKDLQIPDAQQQEQPAEGEQPAEEQVVPDETQGYYDEYGNFIYYQ